MRRPGFRLRLLTAAAGVGLAGLAAAPSVMESAALHPLPYPGGAAQMAAQGSPAAGRTPLRTGAPFLWPAGMPAPAPTPPPQPPGPWALSWVGHALPAAIAAGNFVTVPVTVKNVGTQTWATAGDNRYHLSYQWQDATTGKRYMDEPDIELRSDLPFAVAPGQTATVNLRVRAPMNAGGWKLRVDMVQEGITWFSAVSANTPLLAPVTVTPVAPAASPTPPALPPLAAEWLSHQLPPEMPAGAALSAPVTVSNTGSEVWPISGEEHVHLSYRWYNADTNQPYTAESDIEFATNLPYPVRPGHAVNLPMHLRTPSQPGRYILNVDLYQQGRTRFSQPRHNRSLRVIIIIIRRPPPPAPTVTVTATPTAPVTPTATPTATGTAPVPTPTATGTAPVPTPTATGTAPVPTPTATGTAPVPTPTATGTAPVPTPTATGTAPVPTPTATATPTVPAPTTTATPLPPPSGPLAQAWIAHALPAALPAGVTITVPVTVKNIGTATWVTDGANAFRMGVRWYDAATGARYLAEPDIELRTNLPNATAPGQTVTVFVRVRAPQTPGRYLLAADMVQEGVTWFSAVSSNAPISVPVLVSPAS